VSAGYVGVFLLLSSGLVVCGVMRQAFAPSVSDVDILFLKRTQIDKNGSQGGGAFVSRRQQRISQTTAIFIQGESSG
jgi:hypothetical protein